MTKMPDYKPEPMASGLIIGYLLSVAFILGGVGWSLFGPEPESEWTPDEEAHLLAGLQFPPLTVDANRLADARSSHYDKPDLSLIEADVAELRTTFRKINLSQFPSDRLIGDLSPLELVAKIEFVAGDVVGVTGVRGFNSVGTPHFERCLSGLDDLLAAIESGNLPLSQALENPPASRFEDYREHCGNFLPVLHERHLVTSEGQWRHDYSRDIADILQRYRWADMVRDIYPLHDLLSRYELELLFRWRIEDPEAFPPRHRRQLLARAQNRYLPEDYDFDLAWARLDVANFDLEGALPRFEELVENHPDNELYRAIHDDIARQIQRAQR